jgi:hypothetical protein
LPGRWNTAQAKITEPVLVGPEARIRALARVSLGLDVTGLRGEGLISAAVPLFRE